MLGAILSQAQVIVYWIIFSIGKVICEELVVVFATILEIEAGCKFPSSCLRFPKVVAEKSRDLAFDDQLPSSSPETRRDLTSPTLLDSLSLITVWSQINVAV